MDYNVVKELVEKFWDGECSETEENALREYLRWHDDVPTEFLATKKYMALQHEETQEGLSLDFDRKVLDALSNKKSKKANFKRIYATVGVAAALVAFGFFAPQFIKKPTEPLAVEDTYEDPEQAFLEVKKALMMVSTKINHGKEYSKELTHFSSAKEQIQAQ